MCLSTTCHGSCQLVTTSEEELKVLIYLLLEMSLGMKADTGGRGKEREERRGGSTGLHLSKSKI